MEHSLVEIPRQQWSQLRDLYGEHKKYASGYLTLQNFISWVEQDSNLSVQIYALDGEWQQDGTFIVADKFSFYFNTLREDQTRLVQALNCLDLQSANLMCGFPERLKPAVLQHFQYAGLTIDDFKPESTFWHYLSRDQAAKFTVDVPAGLTLARLELRNAEQVNSVWPHRSPGSVIFVEQLIRFNESVGVFDCQGQLVAWCLRLPLGALGLLQVVETHKRHGLGSLIVRYMSKLIADKGYDVLAPVVMKNTASRALFATLGFQIIDNVYWALKPVKKPA